METLTKNALQILEDRYLLKNTKGKLIENQDQLFHRVVTDNAVSKTINLPQGVRVEDVSDIYMTAWKHHLKGITIYRYGSKDNQVLQKCNLNNNRNC